MADVSFTLTEINPGYLVQHGGGIRQVSIIEPSPDYNEGYGGGRRDLLITELLPDHLTGEGGGRRAIDLQEYVLLGLPLPEVTTGPAMNIRQDRAVLNGTIEDDGGLICDCAFEWGLTDGYGFVTPFRERSGGEVFTEMLTGLLPDTSYHFRAVSWNAFGVGYGIDRIFRTARQVENAYFQRSLFFMLTEDE